MIASWEAISSSAGAIEVPPHLSVVIPFRDEAESIESLHRELSEVLETLAFESEILFVDDESRDEGTRIVRDIAISDPRVRLLSVSPHSGQSAALEAGFRRARGEIVATLDADGQNVPADLPRLLEALDWADCVCGVREERRDSLSKRWASRIANGIRKRVLADGVSDIGCSLRVMRASHLARVKLFHGGHRFLPSLLAMEGARVIELPVRHRPRVHGTSKYGIGQRLGVVGVDLLGVLWLRRRLDRYEVKELNLRA
jgi:glycosyltransferase involved in cell wall biosynthesis